MTLRIPVLALLVTAACGGDVNGPRLQALEAKLAEVEGQLATTSQQLATTREELASVRAQVGDLARKHEGLSTQVDIAASRLAALEHQPRKDAQAAATP